MEDGRWKTAHRSAAGRIDEVRAGEGSDCAIERYQRVRIVERRTGENQTGEDPVASMTPVIATTYKAKLGGQLSYPAGAGEISRALESVPQYAQLSLRFSSAPARAFAKNVPHWIIRISHHYYPVTLSSSRSGSSENWILSVFAVLRKHRHAAHELLFPSGMIAIVEWLVAKRTETWRERDHWRDLVFDPEHGTVTIVDCDL